MLLTGRALNRVSIRAIDSIVEGGGSEVVLVTLANKAYWRKSVGFFYLSDNSLQAVIARV